MNKALLDTDTFSEVGRGVNANVARNAKTYYRSFGFYTLSTVSIMEVVSGYQQKQLSHRINAFLASIVSFDLLAFDQPTAELAGRIAGDLSRTGQSIGVSDTVIAATALVHGLELVTGNTRHFERIRQVGYPLTLVNWRN